MFCYKKHIILTVAGAAVAFHYIPFSVCLTVLPGSMRAEDMSHESCFCSTATEAGRQFTDSVAILSWGERGCQKQGKGFFLFSIPMGIIWLELETDGEKCKLFWKYFTKKRKDICRYLTKEKNLIK